MFAIKHGILTYTLIVTFQSISYCLMDSDPSGIDWLADDVANGVSLLLCKLVLEVNFNIFPVERISRFGQYDRIDDLIPCKLGGEKRTIFRQLLVDEFYLSAVFECSDPLFVRHCGSSAGEVRGSLVYVGRCQASPIANQKPGNW